MSIIQKTREKGAWIIITLIALALIAFIVQDGLKNGLHGLFSGSSNNLAVINGTKIDALEFEKKEKTSEDNYQRYNGSMTEDIRDRIREGLWAEYVDDAILNDKYDALGITVDDKELGDMLYGNNPPQQLRQAFSDPKTGMYSPQDAYNRIRSFKKGTEQYNSFWGEFIPQLEKSRQKEKLAALIETSTYIPKWMIEKNNAESSQLSNISYVSILYSSIPDSTVKVSDDEIKQYVATNEKIYSQEESRTLQYVAFSTAPSAKDSATVKESLEKIKDSFARATDVSSMLTRENSQTAFYDGLITRKQIKIPNIDTIIKTPVGGVFGPYLDANDYVLARIVEEKNVPDTVKVRHILVATVQQNQQGQSQQIREDSTAKKTIDSIELAIKNGANFDSLCKKYSDDPGSKDSGGVYKNVVSGSMVPTFNDFIFGKPVGEKGVVKTPFGYHYIEILSQKGSSPAYKIAYLSKQILASDETVNNASAKASQFILESPTLQKFTENARKRNINVITAADLTPQSSYIQGLGVSRQLVRWAYNDAKIGQVSEQTFNVGDNFVVPVLVESFEKGPMSIGKARSLVEYKLRNEKKLAQITQKMGGANTLEEVAKTFNRTIEKADSINFNGRGIKNIGQEALLIGASFDKDYQTKISPPIEGVAVGAFVIKVDNLTAVANANIDVKQQMAQQRMMQKSRLSGMGMMGGPQESQVIQQMKKNADIKDNRVKFF